MQNNVVVTRNQRESYEYFALLFEESFMGKISEWVNKRAAKMNISTSVKSNMKRWENIEVSDLKKFLTLTFLMGLIRMPILSDYWFTKSLYLHPKFSKTMARHKYKTILRCLCFYDDTSYRNMKLRIL